MHGPSWHERRDLVHVGAGARFSDAHQTLNARKEARPDAPHRQQLVWPPERAVLKAVLDDPARQHRADSRKPVQILHRSQVEVVSSVVLHGRSRHEHPTTIAGRPLARRGCGVAEAPPGRSTLRDEGLRAAAHFLDSTGVASGAQE